MKRVLLVIIVLVSTLSLYAEPTFCSARYETEEGNAIALIYCNSENTLKLIAQMVCDVFGSGGYSGTRGSFSNTWGNLDMDIYIAERSGMTHYSGINMGDFARVEIFTDDGDDKVLECAMMIDDIGKRRITENAGEMLYDLFDRLYSGMNNTLVWVTSNFTLSGLSAGFVNPDVSDGVISRIDRMIESGEMIVIEAI